MAAVCKCKIGVLPFNYLGIPLGADPKKISSWNGIMDRVERKPLRVEFPRLFRLSLNKSGFVKEFSKSNGFKEVDWAVFFSRRLLDREIHDKQGEFSVRKLSELLICAEMADCRVSWQKRGEDWSIGERVSAKGVVKSLWLISVSAAYWSAWLARNELVFERRWPKISNLVFLMKIRALMWIREVYDGLKVNEKIWWVCPVRSWSGGKKSGFGGSFWCSPCFGGVKFNVNGEESERDAGCGGVLRNSKWVVRTVFSGSCVARESSAAEVGAVCLALEVFLEMGWKGLCSLTIEVGSSEVFC
ncbi:hypothetical protein CXB51_000305 [Gossypium anomalum]|uniref:RNase H type-1 domain-containing protein n=1 Tax=Gossypium anomalum TaxID=47600 RepID=A0A8J6DCI9_9ROSI|nr:hypothetical protein CXB51_000305 [Gossypium anomalum]